MKNIYKILLFTLLCVIGLSACSEPPKPEDTFKQYISYWQKNDYEHMYSLLSSETKKNITKKDFVKRYKDIYSGIEASDLKVKMKPKKKKSDDEDSKKRALGYTLHMETLAGPINFSHKMNLILEKKDDSESWKINWDESNIFPEMKKGNRISASTISPKRGNILDMNGNPIAYNGEVYQVNIVPKDLPKNKLETLEPLAKLLGMTTEEIQKQLDQPWVKPEYAVPIKKMSLDNPNVQKAVTLPGVQIPKTEARVYPLKEAAAHLTGYIGSVTAEDLEKLKGKGYTSQDWIGKAGLEYVYEDQLRGTNGGVIKILDSEKNEKTVLADREVINGENVRTTIDPQVQVGIYNQMKGDIGTASAIHPKTGEVLALVSSPTYDPNRYILGDKAQIEKWRNDQNQPLLNRFNYTYAPGSTLKPITAAIGLESGTLDSNKVMKWNKLQWQKDKSWGDYHVTRVSNVPSVDLEKALMYSDNIYFAQAALNIGKDKFVKGLKDFGFGEDLGFSYPYKKSSIGEDTMTEVQLADSGYGQGKIQMSALHLALAYTPFINEGNLIAPKLDQSNSDDAIWKKQIISPETANLINNDLKKVISDPHGTGYKPAIKIPLAGKTGTAELKKSAEEKGKELGWFTAYNTNNPSLLITMMIEGVEKKGGSHYVVPKVKNVFVKNVK